MSNKFYYTCDPSIHTFELFQTIQFKDFCNIFDELKYFDNSHEKQVLPDEPPKGYCVLKEVETYSGLRIQLANKPSGIWSARLAINPLLLVYFYLGIDDTDYASIIPPTKEYWELLMTAIPNALDDFNMIHLNKWHLSRIDQCINIEMGDDFDIELLIECLKRSVQRKIVKIDGFKCDKLADSLSFKAFNKSMSLTIYDKSKQLDLQDGSNILRIESQLYPHKIRSLVLNYDPLLFERCDNDIQFVMEKVRCIMKNSEDIIKNSVNYFLPPGDFYNEILLDYILDEKVHSDWIKDDLRSFILSNTYANVSTIYTNEFEESNTTRQIRSGFINDHGKQIYYSRNRLLKENGVAPVCIPNSNATPFIPSIHTILNGM